MMNQNDKDKGMTRFLSQIHDKGNAKMWTSHYLCNECLGEFIGYGWFRNVYKFKGHSDKVIKISTGKDRLINKNEARIWEIASEDLKKCLCPVIWSSSDGGVSVMKKAKTFGDFPDNVSLDKEYDKMAVLWGALSDLIWDIKDDNVGFIDGRMVIIDYGVPKLTTEQENEMRVWETNVILEEAMREE